MSFNNVRIRGKLGAAFACLILAFLAASAVVLVNLRVLEEASTSAQRSQQLATQSEKLLAQILEQQNALRGYVMQGEPAFAETYQTQKLAFDATLDDFEATTTQAPQKARARKLRAAMTAWRADVGDQVITLMNDPAGREAAVELTGKKSLTALREIQQELLDAAGERAKIRQAEEKAAGQAALGALIIGGLSAMGIALLLGWLLTRTIAAPVAAMTETMERLADGDNAVDIPALARKDELGDMAAAVLRFKEAALEKLALETRSDRDRNLAEAERAAREDEKAREAEEDAVAIAALATALSRLADGDLTHRIDAPFAAKSQALKTDFNTAMDKLRAVMESISESTSGVRSSSDEIAQASSDLSRRTEQQAAALEETAAALDEITATVRRTAEGAKDASGTVARARSDAEQSGQVVLQAVEAMTQIESSSRQVSQIIGVIDEIAFQTNLLALNAGVEAARAGDAGKGFAVVASEVRALAQRSAEAAKEIKDLINTSGRQVSSGVGLVGQTGQALERIVAQVASIDDRIREIAASAQEQATGLHQVNAAINQMDQVVQQNAAMVEQATAAAHALRGETGNLGGLVGRFKLSGGQARPSTAKTVLATAS